MIKKTTMGGGGGGQKVLILRHINAVNMQNASYTYLVGISSTLGIIFDRKHIKGTDIFSPGFISVSPGERVCRNSAI